MQAPESRIEAAPSISRWPAQGMDRSWLLVVLDSALTAQRGPAVGRCRGRAVEGAFREVYPHRDRHPARTAVTSGFCRNWPQLADTVAWPFNARRRCCRKSRRASELERLDHDGQREHVGNATRHAFEGAATPNAHTRSGRRHGPWSDRRSRDRKDAAVGVEMQEPRGGSGS